MATAAYVGVALRLLEKRHMMIAASEVEDQHVAGLRGASRRSELLPCQRKKKFFCIRGAKHRLDAVDRHAIADREAAPSDCIMVISGAISRHLRIELADLLRPPEDHGIVVERVGAG